MTDDATQRSAIVVGGGPAGLMAAEVLAAKGLRVAVHDHMPSVGRKLLLAGRSGLNLTHSEPTDAFVQRYGPATAVADAVRRFDAAHLRDWAAGLGEPTFVEINATGDKVATERGVSELRGAWAICEIPRAELPKKSCDHLSPFVPWSCHGYEQHTARTALHRERSSFSVKDYWPLDTGR